MNIDINNNQPIFVTGAPRSGTSWVGELLGRSPRVRYVYEPFNPRWSPELVGTIGHFDYFTVSSNPPDILMQKADRVFGGRQSSRQILRSAYRGYLWPSIRPFDRVVIKDPTAVLMADWIAARYSAKVLVIMRHPCAFASSIMGLGWKLGNHRFLNQPRLMEDYLSPYKSIIRQTQADPWTRAAAVWSMIHIVLLEQVKVHPEWVLCKYEDLCVDDGAKLAALGEQLGMEIDRGLPVGQRQSKASSKDPGSTNKISSDMPQIWKSRLTPRQIDTVLAVVRDFGLSHLYPDDAP